MDDTQSQNVIRRGATILIVEDSVIQAELLRRFLEAQEYSPVMAVNGADALEAIRGERPDLILADVAMPVMNGFEFCRAVKSDAALRNIPLILLTALTDPRDLLEGLAAGADAYVFKPFDEEDLREKLQRFLSAPAPSPGRGEPIAFEYRNKQYQIQADRQRILEFLITVYENGLRQYRELSDLQAKLQESNQSLGIRRNEVEISRARYKALLRNTKTGFFRLSPEWNLLEANPALVEMLGYESEEALRGINAKDIYVSPDEFAALQNKLLETDTLAGQTARLRRKDSVEIIVEFNLRKAIGEADAMLFYEGFVNDITERERSEEIIERLNDELQMILESVEEGILTLDSEGKHLLVNRAAAKMLGYEIDELTGKPSHPLWHHTHEDGTPYPEEDCPIYKVLHDGNVRHSEDDVFWRKDGSNFPVEYTNAPLRRDGNIVGAVVAFSDITARKQAQSEILSLNKNLEAKVRQRTKELVDAQEHLVRSEKLSVLGQLAGTVGHELRNPLGVINNAIYFLETVLSDADDKVKEYLAIIKKEVNNADQIVGDMLDSVRTKPPNPQRVNVRELLEQVLSKSLVPENITVTLNTPPALIPVLVDPLQMQQVFRNLICNAVEAMPDGGALDIGAEADTVAKTVTISIKDNGVGIPPENMEKLFQPLFTTKQRGIGLGLVVVKNLALANGGSVDARSEPGKGSTFLVTLPTIQNDDAT